jgi:hypothetical protein
MDAYRSILVHMDGSPRCAVRLSLAGEFAREHDAAALPAMPTRECVRAVEAAGPESPCQRFN